MREIKFRFWNSNLNKMLDMDGVSDYLINFSTLIKGEYDVFKVMQYTGLKDKNGREIYEGDLINVANTFRAKVIYKAPSFKLDWADIYQIKMKAEKKTLAWNAHIIYEVIGNIYEDKHLLEGGERVGGKHINVETINPE